MCTYFDSPGREHTDEVVRIVLSAAKEKGLGHLVVASTIGDSSKKLMEAASGHDVKIITVTHNVGFAHEGEGEFDSTVREELEKAGHPVLTATMATRNINKAISARLGGYSQTEIINSTLRMFGQGMKVCPEIAAMAADAGLVPCQDVIAVAGTGRGWDTAVVLQANSSNRFFDIKIKEILCKPRSF
ncbi:MAG: pyruvate kinase alpha/beta domain-containing protein [bacterium]